MTRYFALFLLSLPILANKDFKEVTLFVEMGKSKETVIDLLSAHITLDGKTNLIRLIQTEDGHRAEILHDAQPMNYQRIQSLDLDIAPDHAVTGDFNGDGHGDLLISTHSGEASLYYGNDQGLLNETALPLPLPKDIQSMHSADLLRRDGITDLLVHTLEESNPILFHHPNGLALAEPRTIRDAEFADLPENLQRGKTPELKLYLNDDRVLDPVTINEHGQVQARVSKMRASFVVNQSGYNFDGVCDAHCTLVDAMAAASANPGTDTITFEGLAADEVVELYNPNLDYTWFTINEPVIIDGTTNPAGRQKIRGSNRTGEVLFNFVAGDSVLKGLELGNFRNTPVIISATSHNNLIEQCVFGYLTAPNGEGLKVFGNDNQIGVAEEGRGNVMTYNTQTHLIIGGLRNTVVNNYIGVRENGVQDEGGENAGLLINGSDHTVGGLTEFSRNLIAGSKGIFNNTTLSGSLFQGNYVNVSIEQNGFYNMSSRWGIHLRDTDTTTFGGTTPEAANLVAAAYFASHYLAYFEDVEDLIIQGNYFGIDPDGLPFDDDDPPSRGIFFESTGVSSNCLIGGTGPGMGNIFGDVAYAVRIEAPSTTGIQVLGNSIVASDIGIMKGTNVTVPNDVGDADSGPNNLQNFPQDLAVEINGSNEVLFTYRVDSDPANASYPLRIEFFETSKVDSRDGYRLFAFDTYTESDHGTGLKTINLGPLDTLNLSPAQSLITTATDNLGNTSQFSESIYLTQPGVPTLTVNALDDIDNGICDSSHCSLREAINLANTVAGEQRIAFNLPSPYEILLTSGLPEITDTVHLDGSTQPGVFPLPRAVINGKNTGNYANSIVINADNCTINDLVINRFASYQVKLLGDNNTVQNCYLGYEATGTSVKRNGNSLQIEGSNNLIGGQNAGEGNRLFTSDIIGNSNSFMNNRSENRMMVSGNSNQIGGSSLASGNQFGSLDIATPAEGNNVSNNYFGLSEDGMSIDEALLNPGLTINGSGNFIGTQGSNYFARTPGLGNVLITVRNIDNVINNNVFGLAIDGQSLLGCDTGIRIESVSSTISNNTIAGCSTGILGGGGASIESNYIGTDTTGLLAKGNVIGVQLIGGSATLQSNIIAGNTSDGIRITGGSNHHMASNLIGLDANMAPMGNDGNGIHILNSSQNTIGSNIALAGNTIAANGLHGIRIRGEASEGNVIIGNKIGTDPAGTVAMGNLLNGVSIENAPQNFVGNTVSGNLISGNSRGVYVTGLDAIGNHIKNNFIGQNESTNAAIPNRGTGVEVDNASATQIHTNVIAGNLGSGLSIHESGAVANQVKGNLIGVLPNYSTLSNGISGISIADAPNNTIGGTNTGEANVIGGNKLYGIHIAGKGANNNLVLGNYIGTDPSGTEEIGNQVHGIYLRDIASYNQIGGAALNVIAFNGGDGIRVLEGIGNDLGLNSIYDNAALGIDLNGDGLSNNDLTDNDVGANMVLNYPELISVTDDGTTITVTGALTSHPGRNYLVRFYLNDSCNPGGYGEGAELIGDVQVTTAANGIANFSETITLDIQTGQVITATATDGDSNTSEFSRCEGVSTFADGFESGDTSRWVLEGNSRGSSDLSIVEEARYDGLYGLRVTPGGNAIRLRDNSPANEMRYRLRFYGKFDAIDVAEGSHMDFFSAQNNANEDVLIFKLSKQNGQLLIIPSVRQDDETWTELGAVNVGEDWQLIELDLLAASEGHFVMYTNGEQQISVDQLDNDNSAVDSIRVGAVSGVEGSISGSFDLDDFKAGRNLYIGGTICTPTHLWYEARSSWPNRNLLDIMSVATQYCR